MPIEMQTHFDGHKRLLGLVEPTHRRVRVELNGETIADTANALMLYDHIFAPRFLFHKDDVNWAALTERDETSHNRLYATIRHYDVQVGDKIAVDAGRMFTAATGDQQAIDEYVGFEWDAMDAWYVEDELAYGHARHPYHRIDVRESKRRVQVHVDGELVADSTSALFLFETGLPARYYIPLMDVRTHLLVNATTHTLCPYKGQASYYDVKVGDAVVADAAWYYPTPEPELARIQNYIAFYNEHDDITITVADR